MRKKVLIMFLQISLITLITILSINTVNAENGNSYYTYTIDSDKNIVWTQDAYIAVKTISEFTVTNSTINTLSTPEDIYYQEDLKLYYVADTKNSRILVLDKEFKTAFSVGEGILKTPQGVFADKEKTIYVADYGLKAVVRFRYDNGSYTPEYFYKPDHPLYGENVEFKPSKIAVDSVGTMYIIDAGNANGTVQITKDGIFSGYFGANYTTPDLSYIIRFMFSTKAQRESLYRSPIAPTNLTFDYDGLLNTVTSGLENSYLKRLNIAGTNILPEDIYYTDCALDVAIGPTGTIYTIDKDGFIYEYDKEGNVLFIFGGKDTTGKYIGLFADPKSIEIDDDYKLYVLDKNTIQVFIPTQFSNYVHVALELYNDGKYEQSREPWKKVLQMNNMFDLAHRGLGNAYLREMNYTEALNEFEIAKDVKGYSEAYWEVRNEFLMDYSSIIIIIIGSFCLVIFILNKLRLLEKPKEVLRDVNEKVLNVKPFREFLYLFTFIKRPLDGFYGIQRQNKMSSKIATIWYIIFFIIIVCANTLTGFIFNTNDIETISLLKIFSTSIIPILLFVICNYLISSITDGSGKFRDVYIGTICSFAPIICFYPILILISNWLTLNEEFIYTMPLYVLWGWSFVLLYFMIKDIQDLQVNENNKNIFLTILTMLLFVAFIFLLYILTNQLFTFIKEVFLEVISNA